MHSLTMIRPDDFHIHLRDNDSLMTTVTDAAKYCGRIMCMPNLVPPVTSVAEALAYRQRIMAHAPHGSTNSEFNPLMALYLTQHTQAEAIYAAAASEVVKAVKYYPAGATTNSHAGVRDILTLTPVLEALEQTQLPLLLHGEVVDSDVDIFDREAIFIDTVLVPLLHKYPKLKVVFEHVTTKQAVDFVASSAANVAATLTPQHLLFNRNHMLVGGVKPHFYCLPILKRQQHQQALLAAAVSGNPRFFMGTDSAPHAQSAKENACGCAGCYTAPIAMSLYAQAFEQAGALDKLEAFCSFYGADFYGLPRNQQTITLQKSAWQVPASYPYLQGKLVPLCAGETLDWQLQA